ncbi:MAG: trimeric intracellular cation channel family protein [Oscillospiraceae bacterium]|nr:trimeric intracellular cation channel family protein [Oscillospiraceae bacterium]
MTFLLEIIGTVAFAFAGALVAIDNDLDLFGINLMAVMTACGGGMTRDIIMGNTPPMMFRNPVYVSIAVATAFLTFFIYHKFVRSRFKGQILDIVNVLDAIGLAIFTTVGMDLAVQVGHTSGFLICAMGVLTAVGGGLLRDMMVNVKPNLLTKEIYAMASMVGALVYYYSLKVMPAIAANIIALVVIFGLRMWAVVKKINLPTISKESK